MESVSITLKNQKASFYRLTSIWIAVLSLCYFSFLFARHATGMFPPLAIGLYLLMKFLRSKTMKEKFTVDTGFYVVLAGAFLFGDNYLMGAFSFALGLLYTAAIAKQEMLFGDDGMEKKSFPNKKYSWQQLDYVVLKDNYLTIDFKTDKVYQAEVDDSCSIDEKEFNAFVAGKLAKPAHAS